MKIKNFFDIYELAENFEDTALLNESWSFLDEILNENIESSEEEIH